MCGGGCGKRRAMLKKSAEAAKAGDLRQAASMVVDTAKHFVKHPPVKPTVRRVIIK